MAKRSTYDKAASSVKKAAKSVAKMAKGCQKGDAAEKGEEG